MAVRVQGAGTGNDRWFSCWQSRINSDTAASGDIASQQEADNTSSVTDKHNTK